MTGQTHKESVNRLKEEEKRKYIDRNNASTNNDHESWCFNVMFKNMSFLVSKGPPIYRLSRAGCNDGKRESIYGKY